MIDSLPLPQYTYGESTLYQEHLLCESDSTESYTIRKIPDSIVSCAMEAKKTHPNVFWVPIHGDHVCFGHGITTHVLLRPMTRTEYETYATLTGNEITFNKSCILDDCVLMPSNLSKIGSLPAGHIEAVYDIIIELSAWLNADSMVELQSFARVGVQSNIMAVMDLLSTSAFPGLTRKDMRGMDAYETMELVSMAEHVLGQEIDIDPKKEEKQLKGRMNNVFQRIDIEEETKRMNEHRTAQELMNSRG